MWLRFQHQCLTFDRMSPSLGECRYVISKRKAGLGDCMISLLSAWRYAKMARRTLVVDWRYSSYSNEPNTNVFPFLFQPLSEIGGVPIWCDQTIEHYSFPGPFYPPEWNSENIHAPGVNTGLLHQDVLGRHIKKARDVVARSVVFHGCMSAARPSENEQRFFLSHLIPTDVVLHEVQRFRREHFQAHPVIGVHIRHGNGGDLLARAKYWQDPEYGPRMCEEKIQEAIGHLGPSAVIFLCTDSVEIEQFITKKFPNVISQKKILRSAGEGELHKGGLGMQVALEAMIDMLLLSYSNTLIRFPPRSFFSHYAQLFHGHPKPHLEVR